MNFFQFLRQNDGKSNFISFHDFRQFEEIFECWSTDFEEKFHVFLYKNFQIALAAVIHGASKSGFNLDAYVTEVLFGVSSQSDEEQHAKKQSTIHTIIEAVRSNFISLLLKLHFALISI